MVTSCQVKHFIVICTPIFFFNRVLVCSLIAGSNRVVVYLLVSEQKQVFLRKIIYGVSLNKYKSPETKTCFSS